ncbi:MAG: heparinase II/III domain-containing protein [Chitinophagaceae bacterium]
MILLSCIQRTIILLVLFFCTSNLNAQHPIAYVTKAEINFTKLNLNSSTLIKESYNELKSSVDEWIDKDIDVPLPKDAAGGYTHDKHKANYILMFNAGQLYLLTGNVKYAKLVKSIFFKYAALNPTLKNHPQATSSSPGRIFWQALNDANWLVYTGLAFDCIYNYLTPSERKQIADGAFKPEVDFFTKDLTSWFNLIHNHAVWACAGVGIVGIATDNQDYVDMALYGAAKDKKAGFIAHLNGLFSPDGYYNEGPYYTRYAVLPFYLFANAINNSKPNLKIFEHRNQILKKALEGALQQTNLNGGFYSYNDALKEKTFTSNEVVVALNIAWQVYGASTSYLPIAKIQNRVLLSKGGVQIGMQLDKNKNIPKYYTYKTIEFTDGANGNEGGVCVIRSGKNKDLTTLIYKYSSHGLSHGHYDKLNINLYDQGNEILQDYGAARFINIEQKWGGRYLPETKTYAQQTIAHNTITVDETSHFDAKESVSEKYHSEKLFSNINDENVQVVCSKDDKAYKDVILQRSLYMIKLPDATKPVIIDFFKALSANQHQYDLPFNYLGTVISTNFKYKTFENKTTTLGTKNGYQHLWKEAEASIDKPFKQFTFLNDKTFYTISSSTSDSSKVYFTRIGANDPNFNLRRDPSYIIRTKGTNQTYINAIEIHGNFSSVNEVATNSYSAVSSINKLQDDENYLAAEISILNKKLFVIQSNNNFSKTEKHSILVNDKKVNWVGPFVVIYDNTQLNKNL